jgi:hypothetical protein
MLAAGGARWVRGGSRGTLNRGGCVEVDGDEEWKSTRRRRHKGEDESLGGERQSGRVGVVCGV